MQTLPLKGKRSYGKIASLPPEVRNAVDNMIKATNTCTLADIQKYQAYIRDVTLSLQESSTYSRKLLASAGGYPCDKRADERHGAGSGEVSGAGFFRGDQPGGGARRSWRHPVKPDEEWNDIALDKLLREMNAQTKAVAYARRLDIQSKDDTQAAMGELKAEFFSALGTEHPELYRQLVAALERRQKGAQR